MSEEIYISEGAFRTANEIFNRVDSVTYYDRLNKDSEREERDWMANQIQLLLNQQIQLACLNWKHRDAALQTKIAALEAEVGELRKDKERLDWFDNLPNSYEFSPNLHGQDIRQAIDAVINKCPYHHDEFQVDSKGRNYCEECQREAATRLQQIDDATLGEP